MLYQLLIQNYAIIEELEVEFSGGLNVLTGETGAGKSIIMGALGLILGERADSSVMVNKEKKCVIEATFKEAAKRNIRDFLERSDIDETADLTIRREITAAGKSRAFINDTPVTLAQLNELSSLLVDLHQQFDTLELARQDFQREVLDALAGNSAQLEEYQQLYLQWQQLKKETAALKGRKQQFDKEADYNRFQYNELEEAGFRENELEETDAELKLLSHSENIRNALAAVYFQLQENDSPVTQQLKSMVHQLNGFAAIHPALPGIIQRLQSAQVELQDIAGEIDHLSDRINYDPARTAQLNERLSLGYKLQKKHGVSSTAELLTIQQELEEKLQAVLNIEETIKQKEEQLHSLHTRLEKEAENISARRKKQAKPLEEKVNKLLARVGMPAAKLKVDISPTEEPGLFGADAISFLFDANKSGRFQPVGKVASGGELSRLMLCIKSLVGKSMDLPTMIFDEIDTGISGEAARQVGIIMKELAANRQVLCITHQPQIAGKATTHLYVYKKIVADKVATCIQKLTLEERITAIARMLSGEKPTAAAIENAREMVMN